MLNNVHWIHFRGLTIRNVYQREEYIHARGIVGWPFSNMIFENMTIHNIGGEGLYSQVQVGPLQGFTYGWDGSGYVPYDNTKFINCDIYQCHDTLSSGPGSPPSNMGDGFKVINAGGNVTFEKL